VEGQILNILRQNDAAPILWLLSMPPNRCAHRLALLCNEVNAVGTWKLYSANASNGGTSWVKCNLMIQSDTIIKGTSSCSNNTGLSTSVKGHVGLVNGANCTFNGEIVYAVNCAVTTVTEATMSENKQTVSGIGTSSGGAFIFSLVKIR
jgi:hypothetical protein